MSDHKIETCPRCGGECYIVASIAEKVVKCRACLYRWGSEVSESLSIASHNDHCAKVRLGEMLWGIKNGRVDFCEPPPPKVRAETVRIILQRCVDALISPECGGDASVIAETTNDLSCLLIALEISTSEAEEKKND